MTLVHTVAKLFSKNNLGSHCCNNVLQQSPWSTLLQKCVPAVNLVHIVATMRVETGAQARPHSKPVVFYSMGTQRKQNMNGTWMFNIKFKKAALNLYLN
jgi:hypothetical protein